MSIESNINFESGTETRVPCGKCKGDGELKSGKECPKCKGKGYIKDKAR